MKVMIAIDNYFAHYYIRRGLARVFSAMGHEVVMWDINKKPAFDAFDEFEPDLFVGQTFNMTPAWMKCIQERPEMRVIMKAADWGKISDEIDRDKYPVLIASQQEIDRTLELMETCGKPDFVYVHYHNDRLNDTHGHWRENGVRVESLMNAADVFDFTNGEPRGEYACDIAFVGGRWGYKSQTFDKWFIPMLYPDTPLKIKIFGNQPWGVSQYCGFLPDTEVKHLFASAKICINLSEPHSQKYGYDVVERPFKLWANRCLCISDWVDDLVKLYPKGVYAKTPEDFFNIINNYINGKITNVQEVVDVNYKETIEHHTYFNRVRDIFGWFDMSEEIDNLVNTWADVKERLKL